MPSLITNKFSRIFCALLVSAKATTVSTATAGILASPPLALVEQLQAALLVLQVLVWLRSRR